MLHVREASSVSACVVYKHACTKYTLSLTQRWGGGVEKGEEERKRKKALAQTSGEFFASAAYTVYYIYT